MITLQYPVITATFLLALLGVAQVPPWLLNTGFCFWWELFLSSIFLKVTPISWIFFLKKNTRWRNQTCVRAFETACVYMGWCCRLVASDPRIVLHIPGCYSFVHQNFSPFCYSDVLPVIMIWSLSKVQNEYKIQIFAIINVKRGFCASSIIVHLLFNFLIFIGQNKDSYMCFISFSAFT